jgi:type VI secretion system secreted protein VgrG
MDLMGQAQAKNGGKLEAYDYPGEYGTCDEGNGLAKIRLEEMQACRQIGIGQSDCRRLVPGYRFTLDQHHRSDLNKECLIVRVSHAGSQPQVLGADVGMNGDHDSTYQNQFECIHADVPFRSPRLTSRPVIQGPQTAIVVGPQGEEIYTDKHGRVKVQFHWDREGKQDEKSSCWLRVGQVAAGSGWGALFLPRIGQEVVVQFLEGDPDQPIVMGSVYNGDNPPPYALPGEKTKSTIKSDSTKGGGGSNELRFEDAKGSEEIFLHGQKDCTIAIENDKSQTVGHDETLTISNNRTKTVQVDQSETIGVNKTIQVGANHTESIGSNMTLTVGGNRAETIGMADAETITLAKALTIGAVYQVSVGGAMNETIGGAKAEEIGGAKAVVVGAVSTEKVGGNKSIDAGGSITEKAGKDVGITAGNDVNVSAGKNLVLNAADQITIKTGSASITMKSNGDITIKGKNITIKADSDIVLKGQKILQN